MYILENYMVRTSTNHLMKGVCILLVLVIAQQVKHHHLGDAREQEEHACAAPRVHCLDVAHLITPNTVTCRQTALLILVLNTTNKHSGKWRGHLDRSLLPPAAAVAHRTCGVAY